MREADEGRADTPGRTKCRCRGNNSDCHMCFGSGFVDPSPRSRLPSAPPSRPARKPREPRAPRRARKPDSSFDEPLRRVLGIQGAEDARRLARLIGAAERGSPDGGGSSEDVARMRAMLVAVLRHDKATSARYLSLLAMLARPGPRPLGERVDSALRGARGRLDGGAIDRGALEHLFSFAPIDARRSPSGCPPKEVAKAPRPPAARKGRGRSGEESGRRILHPIGRKKLARMKEEASVPSFLIVLCRSEPDPARLKQCRERIEREKLGYFYLYGERKHMRAIREAIPSARAVEITNSANYDSVRGQPRCSLFDVGLRPEIAPGDDGGKRPPSLRL